MSNSTLNVVPRLPWAALGMTLVSLVALLVTEITTLKISYPLLPLIVVALLASQTTRARLGTNTALNLMLRILVFSVILTVNLSRPVQDTDAFLDGRLLASIGELLAAELAVQAWKRRPDGGGNGVASILLSGLVLMVACNVWDDHYIRIFTPLYMALLLLSLRQFRMQPGAIARADVASGEPNSEPALRTMRNVVYTIAFVVALGLGGVTHVLFHMYRLELTALGMRLLNERPSGQTSGLSTSPHLGPTYGLDGSDERVLRIEGASGLSHLRALSFADYQHGEWGPPRQARTYTDAGGSFVAPKPLQPALPPLTFTRLARNVGLIVAPLNTLSLEDETATARWAEAEGGPISLRDPAPTNYTVTVSQAADGQGLFCASPDKAMRARLLNVPPEVDPRVRRLAQDLTARFPDAKSKAAAIESYLLGNFHYSLHYNPHNGDPVSVFVLHKGAAAHCEYFGSAATILLRCVGIPARYVIGYYAHESIDKDVMVVRQRDAHAWSECWIEGTGWITIDATPGDGRPDGKAGQLPLWMRMKEWVQDNFVKARDWVGSPNGLKAALGMAVVACVVLFWQWRRQTRRKSVGKEIEFAYASPGEALNALAQRFETICKQKGLAVSPDLTWHEYLQTAPAIKAAQATGFQTETALDFIHEYNQARFGPEATPERLQNLQSLLTRLLKTP